MTAVNIDKLFQAIKVGSIKKIVELLEEDPTLATKTDGANHTGIQRAVSADNEALVKVLLDYGANPLSGIYPIREQTSPFALSQILGFTGTESIISDWIDQDIGSSPMSRELVTEVKRGRSDKVLLLLEANPSIINTPDEHGQSALMRACQLGNVSLVRNLIDWGADVNQTDPSGKDVLKHALKRRSDDEHIVDGLSIGHILVERGAKYDVWSAAALGDLQMVQECLMRQREGYSNADSFLREYINPLPIAAFYGRIQVVKLLIDQGQDLDARFDMEVKDGWVEQFGLPIRYATEMDHFEIVKLLLESGASAQTYQYAAGSAVSWANQAPNGKKIADYLFSKGATADFISYLLTDNRAAIAERMAGSTVDTKGFLHNVALTGNLAYIDDLLADSNEFDDEYWWAIITQVTRCWRVGNKRIINDHFNDFDYVIMLEKMLQRSSKANLKGNIFGESLLHRVVMCSKSANHVKKQMINVLLKYGVEVDGLDSEFKASPLSWAAMLGDDEIVKFLIDLGAKTDCPQNGCSPLAWAKRNNNRALVQLLNRHRVN